MNDNYIYCGGVIPQHRHFYSKLLSQIHLFSLLFFPCFDHLAAEVSQLVAVIYRVKTGTGE